VLNALQNLPFSQYDFETEQRDVLNHGDVDSIARFHGTSPTLHSQQLNPHDERKSNLWRGLLDLAGLAAENPARAEQLRDLFNQFADRAIAAARPVEPNRNTLDHHAGEVAREFGEFVAARFGGHDLSVQLSELDDVIREAEAFREGIIQQINGGGK
jgi:hypothetical protein